jgi:hypothetical protein
MKFRILLSVLTGGIFSFLVGGSRIIFEHHLWYDQVFLILVPVVSFSILFWLAHPFTVETFDRKVITPLLLAVVPAGIHLSFLNLAYPHAWQIMLWTVILMLFYGAIFHRGGTFLLQSIQKRIAENPVILLLAGVLMLFPAGAFTVAWMFPALFRPADLLLPAEHFPLIAAGLILTIWLAGPLYAWLERSGVYERLKQIGAREYFDKNLSGIYAFVVFFIGYFVIARGFNPPIDYFSLDNSFFAADSLRWLRRFGTPESYGFGRAVHPLALLLLRIPAAILAFLHNGDWYMAALLLIALAGAGCVFLMWRFVLTATDNPTYALSFAGLLGISASHLVFATVTESYIFSAFGLLWLFTLLQSNERPVWKIIPAGVVTLGITVSNFAQSLIAFFIIRRNWREWLTFTFITVAVGVALTLFTNLIHPRWSTFFFSPTDMLFETKHTGHVQRVNIMRRTTLLGKNLFLYNMAAPMPMHRGEEKEGRPPFPRLNFFYMHPTVMEYQQHRYGPPALLLWGVLLLGAFTAFLIQNRRSPHLRFQVTALALFGFNFILHLDYGFEPFLYTPNWTYLLVIFVALSLAGLAQRRFAQLTFAACLLTLTVNNIVFVRILADIIQAYLPTGG